MILYCRLLMCFPGDQGAVLGKGPFISACDFVTQSHHISVSSSDLNNME